MPAACSSSWSSHEFYSWWLGAESRKSSSPPTALDGFFKPMSFCGRWSPPVCEPLSILGGALVLEGFYIAVAARLVATPCPYARGGMVAFVRKS